jgi:ketosteroid isomerase-like protein
MTRNEAFVREGVAAFNTGDLSAWLAFVDPGARFYTSGLLPDVEPVYEGHDGFAAFWGRWWEPWDQLHVEIETIDDSGGVIAVDLHWIGEGADRPTVEMPLGMAFMVRDGRLTLMVGGRRGADARDRLLNVERFMKGIEAFNRHDIPGSLEVMDSDLVWEHRLADTEGTFLGPDAVIGWYADLWEHFESMEIVCHDIRDLGDGRMLGLGKIHAIGKASGAETTFTYAVVATYRNGRIIHYVDYGDHIQALEAVGLSA